MVFFSFERAELRTIEDGMKTKKMELVEKKKQTNENGGAIARRTEGGGEE